MLRKSVVLFFTFMLAGTALADCPSFNMSAGPDQAALALLNGKSLKLLFLGVIEKVKFVGNFKRLTDINAEQYIDITYHVEDVFFGRAEKEITLHTPLFCEECNYDSEAELRDALAEEIGSRQMVFEWEQLNDEGRLETYVSGGCPASIGAKKYGGVESKLVVALRRLRDERGQRRE